MKSSLKQLLGLGILGIAPALASAGSVDCDGLKSVAATEYSLHYETLRHDLESDGYSLAAFARQAAETRGDLVRQLTAKKASGQKIAPEDVYSLWGAVSLAGFDRENADEVSRHFYAYTLPNGAALQICMTDKQSVKYPAEGEVTDQSKVIDESDACMNLSPDDFAALVTGTGKPAAIYAISNSQVFTMPNLPAGMPGFGTYYLSNPQPASQDQYVAKRLAGAGCADSTQASGTSDSYLKWIIPAFTEGVTGVAAEMGISLVAKKTNAGQ